MRRSVFIATLAALLGALCVPVFAQDAWPSKPVHLIVPD